MQNCSKPLHCSFILSTPTHVNIWIWSWISIIIHEMTDSRTNCKENSYWSWQPPGWWNQIKFKPLFSIYIYPGIHYFIHLATLHLIHISGISYTGLKSIFHEISRRLHLYHTVELIFGHWITARICVHYNDPPPRKQ